MTDAGPGPVVALLVDDDRTFRDRLGRALQSRGWEIACAGDREETLGLAKRISPDLVLLDLKMPGAWGPDLIEPIKSVDPTITIIILTGYGSIATALDALKRGADHYLSKPIDADEVIAAFFELTRPATEPVARHAVPSLARVEWEHIQRVLSDCNGNVSQAARLLGIHRRSLQRKLAKYPPPR
jgi:two-component system response regulator RegA